MAWGAPHSFPRAILHVDGDGFFAGCEVAKNPSLKGKPVITGKERGVVSACTYEAKARGVKRGMRLHEVRALCPEAIILPSDYETYSLFSHRMYAIVRRYTPSVEEYGIDECFADISGMRRLHKIKYAQIAASIKRDLERELGMTFSLGLAATKVLAKIGSKWQKPSGLTAIPLREAHYYLARTPCENVWGIGANTAAYLASSGVRTALDLVKKDEAWVRARLSKPFLEIWRELQGEVALELDLEGKQSYQSISNTKTFTPPSRDADCVFSQLSKNIENACIKARRWHLAAPRISFFLKTQDFTYHGCDIRLPYPSALPHDILREVRAAFPRVYKKGMLYRATGITLIDLVSDAAVQLDLFGSVQKSRSLQKVFESADHISARHGKHAVFLGSSMQAMTHAAHLGERGDTPVRARALFKGETARKHLAVPYLGEV